MKKLNEYINESSNVWKYIQASFAPVSAGIKLPGLEQKDAKWLYINTEDQLIYPYDEEDLRQMTYDLEGEDTAENAIKALKIGEIYNEFDEGINLFVRIKK